MLMSRLRTDRHTDGNVKVEQYSAEAESAIIHTGNHIKTHLKKIFLLVALIVAPFYATALDVSGNVTIGSDYLLSYRFNVLWIYLVNNQP